MLIALGLLALVGFWWLGRSGGRLPFGLTPRRLAGYAAFAAAFLLSLRGSLVLAGVVGLAGVWLHEGRDGLMRRIPGLRGPRAPERLRAASLDLDVMPDGTPLDGSLFIGAYAGRRLSEVPPADLAELALLLSASDPEGARLLQAYLDRRHPGWRVDADRDADPRPGRPAKPGTMSEQEAYQILGLERGATLEQVRAAHRALMKSAHPDQGGSVERAARVNAARDRLLDRHR